MNKTWDYIIVGAGHNGMTKACTLAKAGKSVLIVEQRPIADGVSVSHPFVEAAPGHILSVGAIDDFLSSSPMIDDFSLRQHGYSRMERPWSNCELHIQPRCRVLRTWPW